MSSLTTRNLIDPRDPSVTDNYTDAATLCTALQFAKGSVIAIAPKREVWTGWHAEERSQLDTDCGLAHTLAQGDHQFLTNDPGLLGLLGESKSIDYPGGDPDTSRDSLKDSLTAFIESCRPCANAWNVVNALQVQKSLRDLILQNESSTGVSMIAISPDQAAEFRDKGIVYDLADTSAPNQSIQMSTMLGEKPAIGLCAHPTSGFVVLSNFDPNSLRDDDNTYYRDRTAIQAGYNHVRNTSKWVDPDVSRAVSTVGRNSKRAEWPKCTAKFVELLPSEYALLTMEGNEGIHRVSEHFLQDGRTDDDRYKAYVNSLKSQAGTQVSQGVHK